MAEKKIKENNQARQAIEDLAKALSKTDRTHDGVYRKMDKRVKEAKANVEALSDSFKTFNKVMEAISSKGLAETMDEMPNYVKGISKLKSAFSSYNDEAEKTSEMMSVLGVEFSKTMRELETKSNAVAKSMSNLANKGNKLSSVRDSLAEIPEKLKMIQDSIERTPDIDIKGTEKLINKIDTLESSISSVDFKALKTKIEKLGTETDIESIAKEIQNTLKNIEIIPGTASDSAKKTINDISKEVLELQKLTSEDTMIREFLINLKELETDNTLKDVFEENKEAVESFRQALSQPGITYTEVSEQITSLNAKMGKSFKEATDVFLDSSSVLTGELILLKQQQQELSETFREGYQLDIHTKTALDEFSAVMADLSHKVYTLKAKDIIPNKDVLKAKEMQQSLMNLVDLYHESKEINNEVILAKERQSANLDETLKKQEENTQEIKKQIKHMQELENTANQYLDTVSKSSEKSFGEEQTDKISETFYKMDGTLKKIGAGFGGYFGKSLSKLGDSASMLGSKLKALALPIGLITSAISATKAILKLETIIHGMNKEALMMGAMANTAGNIEGAFKEVNTQLNNTGNLIKASLGGKEFGLARNEIIDITNSLKEGGVAVHNLKEGMKGVYTTSGAVGNEFVNAANMVTTFSTEMGISASVIGQSIGEMAYSYNDNLSSIQNTYTQIAAASKDAGMSQSRFLSAVQTATAGLSLYESQVSSVGKIIASLGKDQNITAKTAEGLAKNLTEFAGNADKVMVAMSQMTGDQKKAMLDMVESDISRLKERVKAGDKSAVNELKIREEWLKDAEGGQWDQDIAARLEFMGAEAQAHVFASALETAIGSSKGDVYALKEVAKEFGVSPEMISRIYKDTGGEVSKMKDALLKAARDSDATQSNVGEMTLNALEKFNLTADPMNKALESIKQQALTHLGPMLDMLKIIAAVQAGGGLVKGLGTVMQKGFGLLAGKGAAATGLKALGVGVSKLAIAVVGIKLAIAAAAGYAVGTLINKADEALGGHMGKGLQNLFSSVSKYFGGEGIMSDDEAFAKAEKMHSEKMKLRKEQKGVVETEKKESKPPMSTSRKEIIQDIIFPEETGPLGTTLPTAGAGAGAPMGEGLPEITGSTLAHRAKQNALSLGSGDTTRNVTNSNNFYINGNDPESMKKFIIETLVEYERGKL